MGRAVGAPWPHEPASLRDFVAMRARSAAFEPCYAPPWSRVAGPLVIVIRPGVTKPILKWPAIEPPEASGGAGPVKESRPLRKGPIPVAEAEVRSLLTEKTTLRECATTRW
jgi:hypothetical protein